MKLRFLYCHFLDSSNNKNTITDLKKKKRKEKKSLGVSAPLTRNWSCFVLYLRIIYQHLFEK